MNASARGAGEEIEHGPIVVFYKKGTKPTAHLSPLK